MLGIIPLGNKLSDYFDRYQSSQDHLNAIIESLKRGKDELMRDNAAIEQEKVNLWALMERLEKYIHIGRALDTALVAQVQAEPQTPRRPGCCAKRCCFMPDTK
jgi:uncharacterized protein YaaN involved in tellurite resistance